MKTPEEIIAHCKKHHYSAAYADYAINHRRCEACGEFLAELPHHILSRGAHGNIDDEWNLLGLCFWCHKGRFSRAIHALGPRRFAVMFPHLAPKINDALNRPRCGLKKEKATEVLLKR